MITKPKNTQSKRLQDKASVSSGDVVSQSPLTIDDLSLAANKDVIYSELLRLAIVPNLLLTHPLNTIGLIISLWFWSNQLSLLVWGVFHLVIVALRSWHQSLASHVPETARDIKRWLRMQAVGAAVSGVCWGSVVFLFYPPFASFGQIIVIVFLAGLSAGATSTLAANIYAAYAFIIANMGAMVIYFAMSDEVSNWGMSFGSLALMGLLLGTVRNNHSSLVQNFMLKFQNEELMHHLQDEKQLAQKQKAMAEDNAHFMSSILENINEGICIFDKNNRLIIHNYYFYSLVNKVKNQISRGMRFSEFIEVLMKTDFGSTPAFREVLRSREMGDNPKATNAEPILWGDFAGEGNRYVEVVEHCMQTGELLFTFRDVSDRYQGKSDAAKYSDFDPLTNCYNQRAFKLQMEDVLGLADRLSYRVLLVVIDVRDLGKINKNHGNAAGDAVIVKLADRIRKIVRRTDIIGRVSGDQFAIILNGVSDERELEAVGTRYMVELDKPVKVDDLDLALYSRLAVSVAEYRVHGQEVEELMTISQETLKGLKKQPQGQFRIVG